MNIGTTARARQGRDLTQGDTIETFLDQIGATIESFDTGMSGGSLFGLASASASFQVDPCISQQELAGASGSRILRLVG